jgi:hypothetical protein
MQMDAKDNNQEGGARLKKKDPLVYALARPSRCYACDRKLAQNEIIQIVPKGDEREVFCLGCAGLCHLEVLPSGDAAVTRLARKYSGVRFVIVKWSDTWKCYERQGLLVEKQALERAQKEASLR